MKFIFGHFDFRLYSLSGFHSEFTINVSKKYYFDENFDYFRFTLFENFYYLNAENYFYSLMSLKVIENLDFEVHNYLYSFIGKLDFIEAIDFYNFHCFGIVQIYLQTYP